MVWRFRRTLKSGLTANFITDSLLQLIIRLQSQKCLQSTERWLLNLPRWVNSDSMIKQSRIADFIPHMQCTIHLHSQIPFCMVRVTAKGCQSAGGNAERGGQGGLKLCSSCIASHWLTSLNHKPHLNHICPNMWKPDIIHKTEVHNILHCCQRRT